MRHGEKNVNNLAICVNEVMETKEKVIEDTLELCLKEVVESKDKDEAIRRLKGLLGFVKSNKFKRIKQEIGAFRDT